MNIKIGILNVPKHDNKHDLIHFVTMDTNRNHYKANFINIAKRIMFLCQKTEKQIFQNGLNKKISRCLMTTH